MSLIFLTSPAKSLDLDKKWFDYSLSPTIPAQLTLAEKIAHHLKNKPVNELQKVLKVSDKIAQLNFERLKKWHEDHDIKNSKPAFLMYNGAVYQQINKKEFSFEEMDYAQDYIRILSGFYGLLKPYDLIQPYRLEMNNKVNINSEKSLVKYWKKSITTLLNHEIEEKNVTAVINLASKEYSQVIDQNELKAPMITIDFKELKNGKLKTIAIYAKKARGAMLEYVVKNQIKNITDIKEAKINGYAFSKKESNHLVFTK